MSENPPPQPAPAESATGQLPEAAGEFVKFDGHRVHYLRSAGNEPAETKTPLLLIHGLLSSCNTWDRVWPELAARFDCIAPDLLGHGYSATGDALPMSLQSQVDCIIALLDALEIDCAHILGQSMGGGIALLLAARHPERVRRLVVVDSVCYPFRMPLKGRIALLPGIGRIIVTKLYNRRLFNAYVRNDVFFDPARIDQAHTERLYLHFDTPAARRGIYRAMRALNDITWLADEINKIHCATKILWGAQDKLIPPQLADRLVEAIPGATRTIVPDCGHQMQTEQPDIFLQEVTTFLWPDQEP